MNGGSGIGLGQHQGLGVTRQGAGLGAELGVRRGRLAAQNPETGLGKGLDASAAVVVDDLVLAVAEEREVVLGYPAQECRHLLQPGRIDRQLAIGQLLRQLENPVAHRLPVLNRRSHLLEDSLDLLAHPRHQVGVRLARHFGV